MMNLIRNSVLAGVINGGNFFPPVLLCRKNLCRLFLLLPALFLVPAAVLPAGEFDLHVNDVSGLEEPWPLIGGLPFPEGGLHDASQIRIVDEEGKEVPAQIDMAATWRDGSIRWALAGLTASPQGEYRVEFGPGVSRSMPETPLRVERDGAGNLSVDTGAAVYEFLPDRLLPESARMGETVFLAGSGDGAYLVDNHDRLSRVAGAGAQIETEILKQGPMRTVVKREGWYLTDGGDRVARARVWFYLSAGSPHMKVTHSLVFTEDTNELWVRDYGLEFRTPEEPGEVVFAFSEPGPGEDIRPGNTRGLSEAQIDDLAALYFSELPEREHRFYSTALNGHELYMLQDSYPHLLERDYRAVVGRASGGKRTGGGNLWVHHWLEQMEVAGDWGEARYDAHALAVVVPHLAQRFPKEIAFGPEGVEVALWSGRSGRELDFRSVTLVNEYWQEWANSAFKAFRNRIPGLTRSPHAADVLAAYPSNARGAARTHDVWLLPRSGRADEPRLQQRASAASHTPLLQADPAWLTATEAIGWPSHPVDEERFAREEEVLRDMWKDLLSGANYNAGLRRTGFISWGMNANLHGPFSYFRISRMTDYNLRRNVWNLYARSGERSYYDYGSRFNQFSGDWELAHWTAGDKFKGEFVEGTDNDLPLHWGSASNLRGSGLDVTGHTVVNWLLEYYMTGNEYPRELAEMLARAYRERGETEMKKVFTSHIYVLSVLYAHEWDETLKRLAESQVERLIDLDNPTGLCDVESRHGVYYKTHRSLLALYDYYRATGDESARKAFLKGVEDKFNYHLVFDRTGQPGGRGAFGRSYSAFLFSIAYRWTGRHSYLRLVNRLNDQFREGPGNVGLLTQMAPFMSVPTALAVLAEADEPIGPFPVLKTDHSVPVVLNKRGGEPVNMRVYVYTSEDVDENAPADAVVRRDVPHHEGEIVEVQTEAKQMFQTQDSGRRNPRRWHIRLTLDAELPSGQYAVQFPDAESVVVLEHDAPEIGLPE